MTASIPVVIDQSQGEPILGHLTASKIDKDSLVIAITESAIFWGNLQAFTDEYFKKQNKYIVPHIDQRPNILELLENLKKWQTEQTTASDSRKKPVLVMVNPAIPMPIVVQTIAALREYGKFEHVALADGLL